MVNSEMNGNVVHTEISEMMGRISPTTFTEAVKTLALEQGDSNALACIYRVFIDIKTKDELALNRIADLIGVNQSAITTSISHEIHDEKLSSTGIVTVRHSEPFVVDPNLVIGEINQFQQTKINHQSELTIDDHTKRIEDKFKNKF